MDAVTLELFNHRFAAICEEMGATLCRTALSANIRERLDFSCALFDGAGDMVAQAAHIPVHLGSMPRSVAAVIDALDLGPGDVAMVNDPYRGGSHLPDVTLVGPVYLEGEAPTGRPDFFVANRAHHADVGGAAPGSMAPAEEIYQEGLIIPPIRLVRGGVVDEDLLQLFLANVRGRRAREGDLAAQRAAIEIGRARLADLAARTGGAAALGEAASALPDYTERLLRSTIGALPDGSWSFTDGLDGDRTGATGPRIVATVTIRGDRAIVDFEGTSPAIRSNLNAVEAVTRSAVLYVFRCLAPARTPCNAGLERPLDIRVPPGSLLAARPPSGVAGGNVETSQRVVDVLLGALAEACPDRIPAASAGTMTNLAFGGVDDRGETFSHYETIAGGMGARPGRDGLDATHTHMTNTRNTPVEALERAFPVRVEVSALRRGSGGEGRHRGGDGVLRRIRFLRPMSVTLLSDRVHRGPWGLDGGSDGAPGEADLIRRGRRRRLATGRERLEVEAGDVLELRTPGGGGHGRG